LPTDTLQVCEHYLSGLSFSTIDREAYTISSDRVYKVAYLQLREVLNQHIENGLLLILEDSLRPFIKNTLEELLKHIL